MKEIIFRCDRCEKTLNELALGSTLDETEGRVITLVLVGARDIETCASQYLFCSWLCQSDYMSIKYPQLSEK